jgi:parallel beta-helix repeat protein
MIKRNNVVCPSLLVVTALAMCFLVQAAQASTVSVGTPNCTSLVNFATIQGAVNAVPLGSTIKICPGNYPEQVVISKRLTLMGIPNADGSQDAVVILPPVGGMIVNTTDQRGAVAAQILVQNTAGPVSISNLTVDGKGNKYTADDLRGINYQDASGVVNHVAVRNEIPNDVPTGDQSGQGILVETTSSSSAKLTVENSSVHNYNKNGIVARYAGANLIATGNYVQGSGPIDVIAQNGIELAFNGATGTIKNNTVIDNFYTPNTSSSADILLYDAKEYASIVVSGNTLGNSNYAVSLFTDAVGTYGDGVSITGNKIFGTSTFDAIDACSNGNIITGNTIFNSSESGIHLDASCGGTGTGNTVSGNTILESACAGILTDPGAGTVGVNNLFYTVPFPVATSTSSCSLPSTPARAKTASKFNP